LGAYIFSVLQIACTKRDRLNLKSSNVFQPLNVANCTEHHHCSIAMKFRATRLAPWALVALFLQPCLALTPTAAPTSTAMPTLSPTHLTEVPSSAPVIAHTSAPTGSPVVPPTYTPTSSASGMPTTLLSPACGKKKASCTSKKDCCKGLSCYGMKKKPLKCLKCAKKKYMCKKTKDCCKGGTKYKCDKKKKQCVTCSKKGKKCSNKDQCCSGKCKGKKGKQKCK